MTLQFARPTFHSSYMLLLFINILYFSAAIPDIIATQENGISHHLYYKSCEANCEERTSYFQLIKHFVDADDNHQLCVFEKGDLLAEKSIILLHGRTWSSLPGLFTSVFEAIAF